MLANKYGYLGPDWDAVKDEAKLVLMEEHDTKVELPIESW